MHKCKDAKTPASNSVSGSVCDLSRLAVGGKVEQANITRSMTSNNSDEPKGNNNFLDNHYVF